ncbi:VanZ family protein [Fictibacillus iocasae]|uniref:VanZ family protein n=1 Tax=Fictibacillus iocasae TaxID=2715437 RepID=A0ABW2NP14_9BACL
MTLKNMMNTIYLSLSCAFIMLYFAFPSYFTGEHTSFLLQSAAGEKMDFWNAAARKWVHLFFYGGLSIILCKAFVTSFPHHLRSACLLSWLITILIGGMDEYYQTFIPGRSGSVYDLAIDAAGACACFVWYAARRVNKETTYTNAP